MGTKKQCHIHGIYDRFQAGDYPKPQIPVVQSSDKEHRICSTLPGLATRQGPLQKLPMMSTETSLREGSLLLHHFHFGPQFPGKVGVVRTHIKMSVTAQIEKNHFSTSLLPGKLCFSDHGFDRV